MIIIGITGTIGAGKGAIVDYLVKKKGFIHCSMSGFILKEIERRGLPPVRDSYHLIGDEFRQKYSSGYIVEQYIEHIKTQNQPAVIESIRSVGEATVIKNYPHAVLLAVDANIKTRYERILKRKSSKDFVSFEKFVADEQSESTSNEPWAMKLPKCAQMADFKIMNDGSMKQLYNKIDEIMLQLQDNHL